MLPICQLAVWFRQRIATESVWGDWHSADLRTWLKGQLAVGEKLDDVRDARPEIRTALERAEHFLVLAALTAVVLAGVAMALAASHFIMRHLDTCAMMRCLGATQAQVLRIFMFQFLLLGGFAVLLGGLLGYAAQSALVQSIETMREAALPPPGWLPLWQAAASGIALLLGFTFLPLWQLKSVSPLRVIRRELGPGARRLVCVRCRCAERARPVHSAG
jgi:putative ABC transport system permease protein